MNRKLMMAVGMMAAALTISADNKSVSSPSGQLTVTVSHEKGTPTYSLVYRDKVVLEPSQLGLLTNAVDFTKGLTFKSAAVDTVEQTYAMRNAKSSSIHYKATQLKLNYESSKGQPLTITFRVADNDVAFRYELPQKGDMACVVVKEEATAFRLPEQTVTFLSPQSDPMIGWMRTKPSYEEEYTPEAPMTARSHYGRGYTFPCLFKGEGFWMLVSETGTNGNYVGCHLADYDPQKGYQIAFPMAGEANGFGTPDAGLALPGVTPWRTITVGETLKPIVETTVAYDVVEPLYAPKYDYRPGRYTWSWLVWQDNSINYADQVAFIDVAAAMGYEYCLVDCAWDVNIGRKRMEELSRYAQSKGVSLLLWYNSNGYENDAPQTPKQLMNTVLARRQEMAWLQKIGVKGIKVDFFAGDKQHTMQLYEDILADANDFGLQVIFHGCTLPRGWERMYPNFVASEAVLASENVYFTDHHARREGFELTMHPFCRNAVATMDWGGTIMNRYLSKDNKSRHRRYTTDVFEMAAAVVCQTSVQCIAMQPNNLTDLPQFELDFLRQVPVAWDETLFLDGYPGKFVILARRSGDSWIVAGLNGTDKPITQTLSLPMFAGKTVKCYDDMEAKSADVVADSRLRDVKVGKKGTLKVTIQPMGGLILQ